MSEPIQARFRAATVAIAPAFLVAAFLSHPHIAGRLPNDAAIAAAVVADPTHWAFSHLAAAVASGLVALAFLCVRNHLREEGEGRWSAPGLGFIVMGCTLYAVLPGMEFAPLAAAASGADPTAAQAALGPWFMTVVLAAALFFAVGALSFAADILGSRALDPRLARLIAASLVVMAASRFVPFATVQFHVQGAAALLALWPLAWVMWRAPGAERAGRLSTAAAT